MTSGKAIRTPVFYRGSFLSNSSGRSFLTAEQWRTFVQTQPVVRIAVDTLIYRLLGTDWRIAPKNSSDWDELRDEISRLEQMLDAHWSEIMRPVLEDFLTLPFGGAVELIWEDDDPELKLLEVLPIDAGTLEPNLDEDDRDEFPVIQRVGDKEVRFPFFTIRRLYEPSSDIKRWGWGTTPIERVYNAIVLLSRGDSYYKKFLSDVPPAGILDLADMSREAAIAWAEGLKEELGNNISGMAIPVLYEHEGEAKFISFGRPPTEILFDKIMQRYTAIISSAFGMTPEDLGLSGLGGETLAGTIRSERKTHRTGIAYYKRKVKEFIDSFLPDGIEFRWIDEDDDMVVSRGRAAYAWANALVLAEKGGAITPNEVRQELMRVGFVSDTYPERVEDSDDFEMLQVFIDNTGTYPYSPSDKDVTGGENVPPSEGGEGEIRKDKSDKIGDIITSGISKMIVDGTYTADRALRFAEFVRKNYDIMFIEED